MDIGLADDPTTCAFCGLKVKRHKPALAQACWERLQVDPPPKKSPQEQLDDLTEQVLNLEEKRCELLFKIAKEEAREDEEFLEELHKDCRTDEDVTAAKEDLENEIGGQVHEWQDFLIQFGQHSPDCCGGALAATKEIHYLCTCGWNHVATELERA